MSIIKKYPIRFVTDYIQYEEWASDSNKDEYTRSHFRKELLNNQKEWEMCVKWVGKEITLQEAEENIEEFGEFIFDGESIRIVNDYLD